MIVAIIVWILVIALIYYFINTNNKKDKFKHHKLTDVRRSWFTSDELSVIDEASQYPEFNMSHDEIMDELRKNQKS